MEKTNVMRVLQQKKIQYKEYFYWDTSASNWIDIAKVMGEDENMVFKTLVTEGKTWEHYVFMVPVAKELDLKKCAVLTGEKYVEMIPQKALLPLTWYVHWGCSPLGMKKSFKTFIDSSAKNHNSVIFSWWKVWYQVEISLEDLCNLINITIWDITKN